MTRYVAPDSPHLVHGTADGYSNHGCRCGPCTTIGVAAKTAELAARARRMPPCPVPGCEDPQYAKGLCRAHNYRANHGLSFEKPIAAATSVGDYELLCVTCRNWLPDAEFPLAANRPHRRGRHSACRACQTAARREYRDRNKVPCSSCGTLVLHERRVEKPPECRPCFYKRRAGKLVAA